MKNVYLGLSISYLTVGQILVLCRRVFARIKEAGKLDTLIMQLNRTLGQAIEMYKAAVSDDEAGKYSSVLKQKNTERIKALRAFRYYLKAWVQRIKVPEKARDASLLLSALRGTVSRSRSIGYIEQSNRLIRLLAVLSQNQYQEAIASINAKQWYDDIANAQSEFERIYAEKINSEKSDSGSATDARMKMGEALQQLLFNLSVNAEREPDTYKELSGRIKEMVEEVMVQARSSASSTDQAIKPEERIDENAA